MTSPPFSFEQRLLPRRQCPGGNLRDVKHFDATFRLLILNSVFKHREAIWTSRTDCARIKRQSLFNAFEVNARAFALFHPHASSAPTAAERVLMVASQLYWSLSCGTTYDPSWGFVNMVVSAEIAGVMHNDSSKIGVSLKLELAVLSHRVNELAVMDHLEICPILRIFVFESVEAVGALGDDFAYTTILERLDVLAYHAIIHVLVAETAQTISAALLISSQYSPRHSR